MTSSFQSPRGFTLVELLFSLALTAILAGAASASWTHLITSNHHSETVNKAQRAFALARSFAVHQKTLTTICPLSQTLECVDDWNRKISIFPDADNNRQPDNGRIHRTFTLSKSRTELYSRTAGRGYFQLSSEGMSHGTLGSLVACSPIDSAKIKMTYVALNISGRVRTLQDDDQDGRIRLPWGTQITCP